MLKLFYLLLGLFILGNAVTAKARNCTVFSQYDLEQRKQYWQGMLAEQPQRRVLGWLVGIEPPLPMAKNEATRQITCLLSAVSQQAELQSVHSFSYKVYSSYRNFYRQKSIWLRKYHFRGAAFDKISAYAKQVCKNLLAPTDTRWQPSNINHRKCWKNYLTATERQQEILQASSAPGISRHHWGSDFDILDPDMNPTHWQSNGQYAKVYVWLKTNAKNYGFIQAYDQHQIERQPAYMEEGWHWSYYPIAQALLEYAKVHEAKLESILSAQWKHQVEYSYIQNNWQSFMFNVAESLYN